MPRCMIFLFCCVLVFALIEAEVDRRLASEENLMSEGKLLRVYEKSGPFAWEYARVRLDKKTIVNGDSLWPVRLFERDGNVMATKTVFGPGYLTMECTFPANKEEEQYFRKYFPGVVLVLQEKGGLPKGNPPELFYNKKFLSLIVIC